ncbi:hypothetical protein [Georgenia wutianyii]|uniref:hypothetical protein n=1 Tax=Georgenia wutianyii TaxID=2585135 RepID=UPI001E59BBDA|nr:hypothetical protein [Georgenia wutianyii]
MARDASAPKNAPYPVVAVPTPPMSEGIATKTASRRTTSRSTVRLVSRSCGSGRRGGAPCMVEPCDTQGWEDAGGGGGGG